ncbi:OBAP family protein [Larkinella humicola]|uniref:DUF1264 domain-containing protein n=1 Tax=Larkinella humicola TaxID=2607654 RepID=A0A5N1JA01_9BACT|nr:OBAP family protein [Larkinella humicola]KAA9349235.1 DUF1264 domain-containing protein [Larkinella humicola]
MYKHGYSTLGWVLLIFLTGCGGKNTSSNVESPGDDKTTKTEVLETGADLLQNKAPLQAMSMYLNGFHFYSGNIKGQMEAHHYCTQLNEDVVQCMIFDGNGKDAKIMGVEYIVSERLFKTLPDEEKKLWHSHHHEVKSETLIAPGLPLVAEHELMEKLVSTYGKTFHTWHTDRDLKLPLGHPLVMMGFTKEGQLADSLLCRRDERFEISTSEKNRNRADIPMLKVQPGANAWEQGEIRQLKVSTEKEPLLHHVH